MAVLSNNEIAEAILSSYEGRKKEEYGGISKKVIKFLERRYLLSRAPEILEKIGEISDKKERKLKVKIASARTLGDKEKKELKEILKRHYGAEEAVLEEKIDQNLLGGMKIEAGGEVIDLSLRYKIKKLQEYLLKNNEQ